MPRTNGATNMPRLWTVNRCNEFVIVRAHSRAEAIEVAGVTAVKSCPDAVADYLSAGGVIINAPGVRDIGAPAKSEPSGGTD